MVVGIHGSTSGQQGYAPPTNPYALLAEGLDSDNDTMVRQMAMAATVGSTLGNKYATPAPPSNMTHQLLLAMQSLPITQQAILQHTAAMKYQANQPLLQPRGFPAPHATPFHMPPIQNLQIPDQGIFRSWYAPFQCRGKMQYQGVWTKWSKCRPILKLSLAETHRATSQQATIVAPEGCTRPFSQMRLSDRVGQRIHTVLQINLTI